LSPYDPLRGFRPFREVERIDVRPCEERGLLVGLLIGEPLPRLLCLQQPELHAHPGLHPDKEGVAEEEIVHLDVDVALDDFVAVFP
jgi:hypothetical protein